MARKTLPGHLCARISDDDQHRLRIHFADLATQAADKHGVRVFQIRKPQTYKTPVVCRAREEVVLALRESVCYWEANRLAPRAIHIATSVPDPMLATWPALSTTDIAALFPCPHSTIVILLQRVERRRAAAAEQSDTEARDDRNRNSDSSGNGCGDGSGGVVGESGGDAVVERACGAIDETG